MDAVAAGARTDPSQPGEGLGDGTQTLGHLGVGPGRSPGLGLHESEHGRAAQQERGLGTWIEDDELRLGFDRPEDEPFGFDRHWPGIGMPCGQRWDSGESRGALAPVLGLQAHHRHLRGVVGHQPVLPDLLVDDHGHDRSIEPGPGQSLHHLLVCGRIQRRPSDLGHGLEQGRIREPGVTGERVGFEIPALPRLSGGIRRGEGLACLGGRRGGPGLVWFFRIVRVRAHRLTVLRRRGLLPE